MKVKSTKIKCGGVEYSIMKKISLLMKASGATIPSTEKENCIINFLKGFEAPLILWISIK